MTTITPITAADREAWSPLWAGYLRFYEEDLPEAVTDVTFARLAAGDGVHGALARDEDGRAIGFVHWLFHPSTWATSSHCYLEDLFVAPGSRSGGVGGALIAHVREQAAAAGAETVYWLTQQSNAVARKLYDRVARSTGFVHYEVAP
jgi:GNAT superfamily N-acetyltransferase